MEPIATTSMGGFGGTSADNEDAVSSSDSVSAASVGDFFCISSTNNPTPKTIKRSEKDCAVTPEQGGGDGIVAYVANTKESTDQEASEYNNVQEEDVGDDFTAGLLDYQQERNKQYFSNRAFKLKQECDLLRKQLEESEKKRMLLEAELSEERKEKVGLNETIANEMERNKELLEEKIEIEQLKGKIDFLCEGMDQVQGILADEPWKRKKKHDDGEKPSKKRRKVDHDEKPLQPQQAWSCIIL